MMARHSHQTAVNHAHVRGGMWFALRLLVPPLLASIHTLLLVPVAQSAKMVGLLLNTRGSYMPCIDVLS